MEMQFLKKISQDFYTTKKDFSDDFNACGCGFVQNALCSNRKSSFGKIKFS